VAIPTLRMSTAAAAIVMPAIWAMVREMLPMVITALGDGEGMSKVGGVVLPMEESVVVAIVGNAVPELLVAADVGVAVTIIVLCVAVTAFVLPEQSEYSPVPFDFIACEQSEEYRHA
jgi:hypothetical protein